LTGVSVSSFTAGLPRGGLENDVVVVVARVPFVLLVNGCDGGITNPKVAPVLLLLL
jgi:hypothetical protein